MSTLTSLLLGLGLLLASPDASPLTAADPARLREILQDAQQPLLQSQAALLLVQSSSADAQQVVRDGLRSTSSTAVFLAVSAAIRLAHDGRFTEELLAALTGGTPEIRQAAALALGEVGDDSVLLRLQGLILDARVDWEIRQAAVAALGRSGRKQATAALVELIGDSDERLRLLAAEILADLIGQPYGLDPERWRAWWERHKSLAQQQWLEERLAYQISRARRLQGELERARAQVVQLDQQLFERLPAGDKLSHLQKIASAEDPALRSQAVTWCAELLKSVDVTGQRALKELLFRLSHDRSIEVQRAAVLALGLLKDAGVYERLHALLQHGMVSVRAAAARALAQYAQGTGAEALARQRQVIPALQRALDDPALEVVAEAAEGLGALGLPEAGPVLAILLRHPSRQVRQTAALALERVADASILDRLLAALDDPAVTVRFSLIGALGHALANSRAITETDRVRVAARLEGLLLNDADPGVRGRAASMLGDCGSTMAIPTLGGRLIANEDSRVQEKAWAALLEIILRSGDPGLLQQWDQTLQQARQGNRRLQLLSEAVTRWSKLERARKSLPQVTDLLIAAQLEQGKWAAAFPLLRETLSRPEDQDKHLRWWLQVGEQALKDGNRPEALRVVQDAQPWLARHPALAAEFEKLQKRAAPAGTAAK